MPRVVSDATVPPPGHEVCAVPTAAPIAASADVRIFPASSVVATVFVGPPPPQAVPSRTKTTPSFLKLPPVIMSA